MADAPLLDWTKGEVMALATFLTLRVGITAPTERVEEVEDIRNDVEVLRFLQTYKYGVGLCAKERDRIYRRAKAYR